MKLSISKYIFGSFPVVEKWVDHFCCVHFDHDESNARKLCDLYGLDYWDALCLVQKSRKLKGIRHTCRGIPKMALYEN